MAEVDEDYYAGTATLAANARVSNASVIVGGGGITPVVDYLRIDPKMGKQKSGYVWAQLYDSNNGNALTHWMACSLQTTTTIPMRLECVTGHNVGLRLATRDVSADVFYAVMSHTLDVP